MPNILHLVTVCDNPISTDQTSGIPATATHLVISAGGNDALQRLGVISEPVSSVEEALLHLLGVRDDFQRDYRQMLWHVLSINLPVAVCTIYNSVPGLEGTKKTVLALFNEIILQEAFMARVPVIDLRLICNEQSDYSPLSPIEPSHSGGAKIAQAICALIEAHDFTLGHSTVVSAIAARSNSASVHQHINLPPTPVNTAKPLLSIELALPDGCTEPMQVDEIEPGHYRRLDVESSPMMEYGVYWGDEFEAVDLGIGMYRLSRLIEPGRIVHLHFPLGLFSPPFPRNDDPDLYQESCKRFSQSLEDNYRPKALVDYLEQVGGALELNDFIQFIWVNVHLPREREAEFLAALPRLCPELVEEKMEYLITGGETIAR